MEFLESWKLDEKLVSLADLYRDERYRQMVSISGPTDTGLIALASQEKCILLTDDSRLFQWRGVAEIELIETVL